MAELAYSLEEFTAETSVSRTQLYRDIKAGRLLARKVGARTIITADDAAAYLAGLPAMGADDALGQAVAA
jgi:hypothetical protein